MGQAFADGTDLVLPIGIVSASLPFSSPRHSSRYSSHSSRHLQSRCRTHQKCCAQRTGVYRMVGSNCLMTIYLGVASDLSTQRLSRQ
jgi:hypothetical protein